MQRETALKGEAIQDLRLGVDGNQVRHGLVIALLIQIGSGLVSRERIDTEFEIVHPNVNFTGRLAVKHTRDGFESFKFARRNIISLDDGLGIQNRTERVDNFRLATIHAKGTGLNHERIAVFVDDQAAEKIALGVHNTKGRRLRKVTLANGQGRPDAFAKEIGVNGPSLAGQHSDADAGL